MAPNILFILTDDLDTESVAYMPRVQALLAQQGVTFANMFVTYPLCCPSRASILTGQYPHNHDNLHVSLPLGGFQKFQQEGREESTVATWLQSVGYRTGLFGKYLNGYPGPMPSHVPPGWTEWVGAYDAPPGYPAFANSRYFNYWNNENGRAMFYGDRPEDYETDVLAEKVLDDEQIRYIDHVYRTRLQSLLAVDEALERIVQTLAERGELANTYIFFTSDNGFHLGQHRLVPGKFSAYEEDIRVPLLVRGPGVPWGIVRDELVLNHDLAPTFVALGGAPAPDFVDGDSLVPLLDASLATPRGWRQDFLVELYLPPAAGGGEIRALRTRDTTYVEHSSGLRELYDLRDDPYQLTSLHDVASSDRLTALSARLAVLAACAGATCRP